MWTAFNKQMFFIFFFLSHHLTMAGGGESHTCSTRWVVVLYVPVVSFEQSSSKVKCKCFRIVYLYSIQSYFKVQLSECAATCFPG